MTDGGGWELELSIFDSCTAEGRLIHYHSFVDSLILKEIIKKIKGTTEKEGSVTRSLALQFFMDLKSQGRKAFVEQVELENLDVYDSSIELKSDHGELSPIFGNNGIMTMNFHCFDSTDSYAAVATEDRRQKTEDRRKR